MEKEMIFPLPNHGGQLRSLSERYGIPASHLLDFSANINPEGPPAHVLAALRAALEDNTSLTHYPDLDLTELRQAIARYVNVPPECVSISNGFVPLLESALHTLRIKSCVLPVPAFNEYRKTLTRACVSIKPALLSAEDNFSYNIEALFGNPHDAVLLANPQNPSGILHDRHTMLSIIERAAKSNTYILLDEAFIDYAPAHSMAAYVDQFPNMIVFRSVTKFHGIPGMRVSYAVTNAATARALNQNLPPWPVTTLAAHAVVAALADDAYIQRSLHLNHERRAAFEAGLEEIRSRGFNVRSYRSAANFLLLFFADGVDATQLWERMLIEQHIVTRLCTDYEALPAGHIRVAVRTDPENQRFLDSLLSILESNLLHK
jgi:threonine-phosphate decarboxylase